jgi:hypothetical protein
MFVLRIAVERHIRPPGVEYREQQVECRGCSWRTPRRSMMRLCIAAISIVAP